jgi:hypothetical protein
VKKKAAWTGSTKDFSDAAKQDLGRALANWQHVWTTDDPASSTSTILYTPFYDNGQRARKRVLLQFTWSDLRRDLSDKHYSMFRLLFDLLRSESDVAEFASMIADHELKKTERVAKNLPPGGATANRVASAIKSLGSKATVSAVAAKAKASKSYVSEIMSGKK